jgi:polygalacturonase
MLLASLLVGTGVTAGPGAGGLVRESERPVTKCPATGSPASRVIAVRPPADPTADSSARIQQAIGTAARSGGAIVQLPKGRVLLDRPLRIRNNVWLRGSGAATVLKASDNFLASRGPHGGHPLITTDEAANVTISRLTADHSGDVLDGNSTDGRMIEYLIDVRHSRNAIVRGVHTRNPFTYSIAVVGSTRFCVRNNDTRVSTSGKYDQLDGIHILDSHNGLVYGNHVDQGAGSDGDDGLVAHTIARTVHDVTYRGNAVRGGSYGAAMQLALGHMRMYNIIVTKNRFWGSPSGIHTGYYGGGAPIHNVAVTGNRFVDNDGPSVEFSGSLSYINVTNNVSCRSGEFSVASGKGNRVAGNSSSC